MATLQARARSARVVPPAEGPADDLLDCAGPVAGAYALVIGTGVPETLFGLIRRGAVAAAYLRRDDRSSAVTEADLVIIPRCSGLEETADALALARRVLNPGGRVVLRDAGTGRSPALARLLATQGFSGVRCRARPSGAVLTADLPFHGPACSW